LIGRTDWRYLKKLGKIGSSTRESETGSECMLDDAACTEVQTPPSDGISRISSAWGEKH
jgi:hypothetical protein